MNVIGEFVRQIGGGGGDGVKGVEGGGVSLF